MLRSFISLRAAVAAVCAVVVLALCAGVLVTETYAAPIAFNVNGGTYTQNFDTLANSPQGGDIAWSDGVTLAGWYANNNGVTPATYRVNNGSAANTNSLQSNGTSLAADRALGTQSNTTSTQRIGVAFTNSLSAPISSFTAIYDGEEWRRIQNEGADGYTVQYQIFNAGLGSVNAGGAWTTLASMAFNAPNVGSASPTTALDGNLPGNRVAGLTATVNNLNWQPGQELWIRFTDTGVAQHQMAIDNFSFTASFVPAPEPSSFILLGLGALCLGRSTRRSKMARK